MTFGRLLLRNLFYHWRGNLAVLLGVVVGTAVLTGALLVGDSLRGSLRRQTLRQLGQVDQVLVAGRLIRQDVAELLAADKVATRISPALFLQGTITSSGKTSAGKPGRVGARAGRVNILGVDDTFWKLWPDGKPPTGAAFWKSAQPEVVLNKALADELKVDAGDTITLNLQKVSAVPRESILGRQEGSDIVYAVEMKVAAVLDPEIPGSLFNLNPSPATPRNAFIPLAALQAEVARRKPNQPKLHLNRPINALLVEEGSDGLQASLARHLDKDDWGIVLRGPEERARAFFRTLKPTSRGVVLAKKWSRLDPESGRYDKELARQVVKVVKGKKLLDPEALVGYYHRHHNYLALESRQLFVEDAVARAAKTAAGQAGLIDAPTLVYLADQVAAVAKERKEMNYVVIAALNPALPSPLGSFLPPGVKQLQFDDIVLVDWKGSPLGKAIGSPKVVVTYYDPEDHERPPVQRIMHVAGWIDLERAADDPDLAPVFPGITDQPSLKTWDPPAALHYRKQRVTSADEEYWEAYRATPKAYVNLATGQKRWGSRFGKLTSIRLALANEARKDDPAALAAAAETFEKRLLENLDPEQGGLVFDAVRARALDASSGGNDFGMLFLGFSIFIIVAALLLVGLLFRLNLDRRASEIGLLLATGIRRGTVRWLLLAEGSLLAAVGGLLGLAAAVLYAWLLLEYLRAWWPGGLEQSFLHLDGTALSYGIGYAASLAASVLTILWSAWVLGRVSPRALLAGETPDAQDPGGQGKPGRWRLAVVVFSLLGAVACLVGGNYVSDHEMQAMTFFGSGFFLLVAGLIGVWSFLRRDTLTPSRHVATLGIRNASRHARRSLLTVGLLASATFLVIAVESFHRDVGKDFATHDGGSGGFPLLAESEVPIYLDLQSKRGRDELAFDLKQAQVPANEQKVLDGISFYSFRLRKGDDASCLNLARTRRPRLLGVPHGFVDQDRFRFQASEASSSAQQKNPWLLLEQDRADGVIPVIGDVTTVKYTFGGGLGTELPAVNEKGETVRLRIVALLQDSIFQSELLMSDTHFRKLYPHQGGYQFFLIDAPPDRATEVKNVLEAGLANHGLTVTPTRQRLETYLAVENTYLSTFQALGGLGLLLGALGLAVVLLRSVWERRGELALLRALGFRRSSLGWLVLAENSFLLALGLLVGAVSALIAVAPHVLAEGGEVPWLRLGVLLGLVLLVGLLAGAAAVASTLRAPLVPALRRE